MRSLALLLGLWAAACLIAPGVLAYPFALQDEVHGHYNLAVNADRLEDPEDNLTIQQVSSAALAGKFQKNNGKEIDLGHSRSTWWLRFKLRQAITAVTGSDHVRGSTWFLEMGKPGLGELDLYIPTTQGWVVKKTGVERSVDSKEVLHRSYVLELPPDFSDDAYFYLRVKSDISLNFSLTLWRPSAYAAWTIADFYGFGAIYGVILSMVLYNFFLFLTLRDKTYLFYVLYIVSMFTHLQLLYGHLATFISIPHGWPIKGLWISAGLSWMAAGAFCRSFLATRDNVPLLDKVLLGIMWFAALPLCLGMAGFAWQANMLNCLLLFVAPMVCLWSAILCLRQGFEPAKYFIFAWIILLIGLVLYNLGGVFIERTFITRYTLAIGVALESLLLSLALAARIRAWRREKETLKQRERYLKHLSITDGLTGLYNRRHFMDTLSRQVGRSQHGHDPLSLLIMDVDNFKEFNDRYGHDQGDEVLVALALLVKECARASDSACRYGGEEFALILPNANLENALSVAERIRSTFAAISFSPRIGCSVGCSVSAGVAQLETGEDYPNIIRRADQALYRAKQAGRNLTIADSRRAAPKG